MSAKDTITPEDIAPTAIQMFEEELGELMAKWSMLTHDNLISALELQLYALQEAQSTARYAV